jgi:hypothetical protein
MYVCMYVCEQRIRVHSAVARILNIDGLLLVIEIWMAFIVWIWMRWISLAPTVNLCTHPIP